MKYPKLFPDQIEITDQLLESLTNRGLLIPKETRHQHPGHVQRPQSGGDVVSHTYLREKVRTNQISEADAKVLLAIESVRKYRGPRETHIDALCRIIELDNRDRVRAQILKNWEKQKKK